MTEQLIFLPFLPPPIIIGLLLPVFFRNADLNRGPLTTIIGHADFLVAVACGIVLTRLTPVRVFTILVTLALCGRPWRPRELVLEN